MYTVSPAFDAAIHAPGRTLRSRLAVAGGVTLDDTVIQSMEFRRAVTPDSGLLLGTTIAAQVTVKLLGLTGELAPEDFTGRELTPSIAVQLADESFEYVPMGLFTADQPVRRESGLEIVAYDRMVRMEKPYVSELTYPSTLGAVLQEAATLSGLTLATPTFLNSTLAVPAAIEGATCRQIAGFAAEVAAGFARITRDGELELVSITSGPAVETITPANYYPPMSVADEFWWADGVTVKTTTEDVGMTYGVATRPWAIVGNPFLVDFPESAIQAIVTALNGVQLWPFAVDWQGNPALDPGDPITVQDAKTGIIHTTIAGTETLRYSGGLRSTLALAAPSAQQQATDTRIDARKQTLASVYSEIRRTAKSIELRVQNGDIPAGALQAGSSVSITEDAITLAATLVNIILQGDGIFRVGTETGARFEQGVDGSDPFLNVFADDNTLQRSLRKDGDWFELGAGRRANQRKYTIGTRTGIGTFVQ